MNPKRWLLRKQFIPIGITVFVLAIVLGISWFQKQQIDQLEEQLKTLQNDLHNSSTSSPQPISPKEKLEFRKELLSLNKDLTTLRNGIFGSAAQVLGAGFFFVTAYFTWRNVKATEEKQGAERFSKAIEQLNHEKSEIQLGGIYALEQITRDSQQYHWTVMEVLTAFIRSKSTLSDQDSQAFQALSATIHAALTVIGRRIAYQDPPNRTLNLMNAHFAEANLVDPEHQTQFGSANLSRANLHRVKLVGAMLERAIFDHAILTYTALDQAQLSKGGFVKANLSYASLTMASLQEANLSDANLGGATLIQANLQRADCSRVNFSNAYLTSATFTNADLSHANLTNAHCPNANFAGADLQGAILSGAKLSTAIALTQSQIDQAILDQHTELPKGLKSPIINEAEL
jgi:uncharacterized protein YjbI with pentapeptide repeats